MGDVLEVLRQVADPQARAPPDAAAVELLFAEDQPQERRLADAVGADQSDAAARAQVGRGVLEQGLGREVFVDGFELEHGPFVVRD